MPYHTIKALLLCHNNKYLEYTTLYHKITTQGLPRLGADFASIDINNSYITHSKSKNAPQIPDQTKRIL